MFVLNPQCSKVLSRLLEKTIQESALPLRERDVQAGRRASRAGSGKGRGCSPSGPRRARACGPCLPGEQLQDGATALAHCETASLGALPRLQARCGLPQQPPQSSSMGPPQIPLFTPPLARGLGSTHSVSADIPPTTPCGGILRNPVREVCVPLALPWWGQGGRSGSGRAWRSREMRGQKYP